MKIVFGGAYQGKTEYAEAHLGTKTWFVCSGDAPEAKLDFSKDGISHLEQFTLACVRAGTDAAKYLEQHREHLTGKVILCDDISQGIVPIEPELRAWREMNGRALIYLCREAEQVIRVFCGLGQRLK